MALESKLEAREKEVEQLTRALEKSDEHTNSLENELRVFRSRQSGASSSSNGAASSGHCVQQRSSVDNADCVNALTSADGNDTLATNNIHGSDTLDNTESCRKKLRFATDGCETDLHGGP